jgi:hypothetical protein
LRRKKVVGLVKQRLAWEAEYALGAESDFLAFKDYKEKRLSEYYRQSKSMEKFYEYVISLENKIAELTSSR